MKANEILLKINNKIKLKHILKIENVQLTHENWDFYNYNNIICHTQYLLKIILNYHYYVGC